MCAAHSFLCFLALLQQVDPFLVRRELIVSLLEVLLSLVFLPKVGVNTPRNQRQETVVLTKVAEVDWKREPAVPYAELLQSPQ